MTVPGGATSLVTTESIALKKIASPTGGADQAISTRWEPLGSLGSDDHPVMNRQLTLQQYSYDDYADDQEFDTPLNGDTQPRLVHFKVVEVDLLDATGGAARPYRPGECGRLARAPPRAAPSPWPVRPLHASIFSRTSVSTCPTPR
mgnify:CR=1 FL=1